MSAAPALAQDPDDELDLDDLDDLDDIDVEESKDEDKGKKKDDEDEAPEPAKPDEPDDGDVEDESLLEFEDEDEEDIDLLGEDQPDTTVGGDSEAVYRETAKQLSEMGPDEEMAGWEEYLEKYPETVFRKRIEARNESLMDQLYDSRIDRGGSIDAMDQEIGFAQAVLLDNIDPRTRFQAAFEWGFPDYVNLVVDYEHQITRKFSVHAGVRRRYQGFSIEFGPHWSIIKSKRTNTLLTFLGDVRLNANPFFPALRPQLALGRRIGKTDIQLQGGGDLEIRPERVFGGGTRTSLQSRVIGGFSLFYAASERVGVFAEAGVFIKPVAQDSAFQGGAFQFNTATLGLKFFPAQKNRPGERPVEANLGATVPVFQNWWQFHFGSLAGQFNYYL